MAFLPRIAVATLIGVVLALGSSPVTLGADNQWSSYGALPGDAPVFSLAASPSQSATVYAATIGASLVQTDDGVSWHEVSAALPRRVWRIAIDASASSQGFPPMYVGSAGDGVWKSLDGGKAWSQVSTGLDGAALNVRAIALGVHVIAIGTSNGVYKSEDGGGHWQAIGLQGYDVSALAFSQFGLGGAQPQLIAGIDGLKTPGSRLLSNSGLSGPWSQLHQGVPQDLVVSAIAAGPVPQGSNTRPLWVTGNSGVLKSDDGGANWALLSGLPNPLGFEALAASPADPNIVYVGSDGSVGASGGGVWRTTDRGGTWQQLSSGLVEHAVTALSVSRENPASVVAATYTPDARSVQTWQLKDSQAPPAGSPESGFCPEPSCGSGAPGAPQGVHGSPLSGAPLVNPCPTPSPSSRPSPSASASASSSPPAVAASSPSPSPSASASPRAPTPCAARTPGPGRAGPGDVPVWLALAAVALLLLVLMIRIVLVRR